MDAAGAWDLQRKSEIAMDALRCAAPDFEVDKLAGGERRGVALCCLLLRRAGMVLLRQAPSLLDAEDVAWLERFLQEYPGSVVAVTHDRYLLDNVPSVILE